MQHRPGRGVGLSSVPRGKGRAGTSRGVLISAEVSGTKTPLWTGLAAQHEHTPKGAGAPERGAHACGPSLELRAGLAV